MKVLEKGIWDNPWQMEARCSQKGCGAKLLIEEGDVKPVDYGNGYYALCMICEGRIPVLSGELPIRVSRVCDKKRKYSSGSAWD